MTDAIATREALIADLTTKLAKSEGAWPKLPWRVVPCDGKPIIAGTKHGGNLFRGYIATWDEAELAVAAVNALPTILGLLAADRAAGEVEPSRLVSGLQDVWEEIERLNERCFGAGSEASVSVRTSDLTEVIDVIRDNLPRNPTAGA